MPNAVRAQSADLEAALRNVLAVEIDGSGSAKAAEAFSILAAAKPSEIPIMLSALDHANPIAANWIYGSIDAVVNRAQQSGMTLPADSLESFVLDANHSPRARQRAFTLLASVSPERSEAFVSSFLADPSPLFRRDAVEKLIGDAEAKAAGGADESQLLPLYYQAYSAALAEDQINAIAKKLVDAGESVDLPRKFGYLTHWRVIGPFDNSNNAEFDTAYPPEKLTLENFEGKGGIHSDAAHEGKLGDVNWKNFATGADNGEVNLNEALADESASIGYGAAVFTSDKSQDVELRLRIQNAFKVWVNGELVMSQPIGHTGNSFDQYSVPVQFRQGKNLILVKSCQIERPASDPWFSAWQFCVRVTDKTGAAVLATDRKPTPPKTEADGQAVSNGNQKDGNR
ncbi:MAG: hypothetical protein MPJ50_07425 [Pirellulales bacterium]|nr:hypothetical protein [Pirellulales bacterium]